MIYYTDDPASDASRYYADQEDTGNAHHCCMCGRAITDYGYYFPWGELWCEECLSREFLVHMEDFER